MLASVRSCCAIRTRISRKWRWTVSLHTETPTSYHTSKKREQDTASFNTVPFRCVLNGAFVGPVDNDQAPCPLRNVTSHLCCWTPRSVIKISVCRSPWRVYQGWCLCEALCSVAKAQVLEFSFYVDAQSVYFHI